MPRWTGRARLQRTHSARAIRARVARKGEATMKTYTAARGYQNDEGAHPDGFSLVTFSEGSRDPVHVLPSRLDLHSHSPTGFAWGYAGSGPAQLALALLAEELQDDDMAMRLHQRFKDEVIARLSQEEGWTLTGEQIRA